MTASYGGARVGLETQIWRRGEVQMNTKKNSTIAICLTAILALSPVASFAQATTTFSGEAVALRANALGISLARSDTGPLAASGGEPESIRTARALFRLGFG